MTDCNIEFGTANDFDETLERRLLDYMAEFAAGAGHELNNPLAIIRTLAQRLLATESQYSKRRDLARIIEQTKRAYEMIADVRAFSRPPKPVVKPIDCRQFFLDWVEREKRTLFSEKEIIVSYDAPLEGVFVDSDETILATILGALGKNASEAVATQGRVHYFSAIKVVQNEDKTTSRFIEFGVEDDGDGIPEETRRLIFAPFFSGRQAGRGLGFGLTKALRYSEVIGARLFCVNSRAFATGSRWSVELKDVGSVGD